jgi:DNA-binding NarL/FixJ family response regulator
MRLENILVLDAKKNRIVKKAKTKAVARHRIFIVEDHPVFREGLVQLVNGENDLEVCGATDNAKRAFRDIGRLNPELALVDISLPGKNGLELIKELRAANRKAKLLVVSMHDEAIYADRVLRAGGDGYIMKEEDPQEIIHAIHDVLAGHIYVSEEVLAGRTNGASKPSGEPAPSRLDKLADSDLQILELLGHGSSDQEIAAKLGLTPGVVNSRCQEMQKKLSLKHANELIRFAVCWIESGEA